MQKTVVRPAMLCCLETVAQRRQEAELEAAEVKMLRFSVGVMRMDRITNEYPRDSVCLMIWRESQRSQTEMAWTCTEEGR